MMARRSCAQLDKLLRINDIADRYIATGECAATHNRETRHQSNTLWIGLAGSIVRVRTPATRQTRAAFQGLGKAKEPVFCPIARTDRTRCASELRFCATSRPPRGNFRAGLRIKTYRPGAIPPVRRLRFRGRPLKMWNPSRFCPQSAEFRLPQGHSHAQAHVD